MVPWRVATVRCRGYETDDIRYEVGDGSHRIGDEVGVLVRAVAARCCPGAAPSEGSPLGLPPALLKAGPVDGGIGADALHGQEPVSCLDRHLSPELARGRWGNAFQDRGLAEFQLSRQQYRLNP